MPAYKVKKELKRKQNKFPLSSKFYSEANKEADVVEKKKYPKGYEKLKKLDKKLSAKEIMGHISKSGKVTVSKKVPKKYRKEVAFHDKYEKKTINRLGKSKVK